MDTVFLGGSSLNSLGREDMDRLKDMAAASPRRTARYCLHADHAEAVQQMVIAIQPGACTMPHRQPGRRKSYIVMEGSLLVVFFRENGAPERACELEAGSSAHPAILGLANETYHTTLCLGRPVVYVETIAGPFDPAATDWAPWRPDMTDEAALRRYIGGLIALDGRLAAGWPEGLPSPRP
jgi:cupin fold WbuC family metalloprotein